MEKPGFTLRELSQYNGKNGTAAFIAYKGKVYDVSRSFLWQNGCHQVMHVAGSDLTDSLAQAPHGADLLQRFPVVGELIADGEGPLISEATPPEAKDSNG
jgi:predicted heme/steroid binding protein